MLQLEVPVTQEKWDESKQEFIPPKYVSIPLSLFQNGSLSGISHFTLKKRKPVRKFSII